MELSEHTDSLNVEGVLFVPVEDVVTNQGGWSFALVYVILKKDQLLVRGCFQYLSRVTHLHLTMLVDDDLNDIACFSLDL